jgi:hypothetical protein
LQTQLRKKQSFLNSITVDNTYKHGRNDFKDQMESGKHQIVEKNLEEKKLKLKGRREYYLAVPVVPANLFNFFKNEKGKFIYSFTNEQKKAIKNAKDENELEQIIEQIRREHDQKFIRPFIGGGIIVIVVTICFILISW